MIAPRRLTDRQREVVALIAEGLTYAQIGKRLHIQPRTVRMHVEYIARELPGKDPPYNRLLRHLVRLIGAPT